MVAKQTLKFELEFERNGALADIPLYADDLRTYVEKMQQVVVGASSWYKFIKAYGSCTTQVTTEKKLEVTVP